MSTKDIKQDECMGHTLINGTTRIGKSSLSKCLITQDSKRGDVKIIIDPKGDAELLRRAQRETQSELSPDGDMNEY